VTSLNQGAGASASVGLVAYQVPLAHDGGNIVTDVLEPLHIPFGGPTWFDVLLTAVAWFTLWNVMLHGVRILPRPNVFACDSYVGRHRRRRIYERGAGSGEI
jgi:hypothetical protein